jgi:hypothetical protein
MDDEDAADRSSKARWTEGNHRTAAIVGACLIVLLVAYGLLSTSVVNGFASAVGGRPNTSFYALSFADPLAVAAGVPQGTPVKVAVSNHSPHPQMLDWSTSSSGVTLQHGSIAVPEDSTRTFVVQTQQAQVGTWFSVRLDGTSLVINTMVL